MYFGPTVWLSFLSQGPTVPWVFLSYMGFLESFMSSGPRVTLSWWLLLCPGLSTRGGHQESGRRGLWEDCIPGKCKRWLGWKDWLRPLQFSNQSERWPGDSPVEKLDRSQINVWSSVQIHLKSRKCALKQVTLPYSRDWHNIVNQQYFNKLKTKNNTARQMSKIASWMVPSVGANVGNSHDASAVEGYLYK